MEDTNNFTSNYFKDIKNISERIDYARIDRMVHRLVVLRNSSARVFVLGIGGSAGNASHMVNDLRKLCGIEAYCPTDNVSEITARTNDDGFETIFTEYLKISKVDTQRDCIFALSVGGGNREKNVSLGLIKAAEMFVPNPKNIMGIIGKKSGFLSLFDGVIVVPEVNSNMITPYSESYQSVIWHCIVSHPLLKMNETKW